MNFHFQDLIPQNFSDSSKVWVYQANRPFSMHEALQVESFLQNFTKHWLSHGDAVKGFANLFFGQFIIVMADETATAVGGCSTDSSQRIIKNIEQDFHVDLFDRQTLAFAIDGRIQLIPMSQLNHQIETGVVTADTLYFNNTILTKKDLLNNWIVQAGESWLSKRFSFSVSES